MNPLSQPAIPQPDPTPLSAPAWLLWGLLILTFALHVVAMNVMLGGSIVAAFARRRRGSARPHAAALAAWFAGIMPATVAATVTLGVAPLLFVQALFGRLVFTSSVLIGWYWLAVIPVLIVAYYASYALSFDVRRRPAAPRAGLGWLAAVLLAAIAFVYVNNMSLVWRPDRFAEMYAASARGLHLNVGDATLVPRYLHMVLGALAVAGMAVALLGVFRRGREPEFAIWAVRHGGVWFTAATSLNLLAGIWWLVALPRPTLIQFMRGDQSAALVLAAGVVLGLAVTAVMFAGIQAPRPWIWVKASSWLLGLTVVFMVITRDQLRRAAIAAGGYVPQAWVEPQWGPILVFAGLLVVAAGAVGWMVWALARGRARDSSGA